MAKKLFLLQGFTPETHRDAILNLFDVEEVQCVIISVAFANLRGVKLLESALSTYPERTTAFIGIRNGITTLQGAQHLHGLGVDLYTVDTGTRRIIFHPKIYLVRGAARAKLIIGSANLTPGGLNNNIEAGLVVECDLQDDADRGLVESVEALFHGLPADYPENIKAITDAAQLDAQHRIGLLPDEMDAAPPQPSTSGTSTSEDTTPRIRLQTKSISGEIKAAKRARTRGANTTGASGAGSRGGEAEEDRGALDVRDGVELELVWQSKELTRRDLNVPVAGRNTNRTGSINLDKGLLEEEVDHRHYFREDVFGALTWLPSTTSVDETYARFHLVIKGVSYGDFDLRIAHTTSTTSRTYEQRNAMTRLSWGPAREFVARPDLIGRRLSLYRDKAFANKFVLEID